MKIQIVRYFLALCEEENFTRAARRCGVSQPSLSNAIKSLEQELGGQLFRRGPGKCSISELGQAVRPYMANIERNARNVSFHAARVRANHAQVERRKRSPPPALQIPPILLARADELIE